MGLLKALQAVIGNTAGQPDRIDQFKQSLADIEEASELPLQALASRVEVWSKQEEFPHAELLDELISLIIDDNPISVSRYARLEWTVNAVDDQFRTDFKMLEFLALL